MFTSRCRWPVSLLVTALVAFSLSGAAAAQEPDDPEGANLFVRVFESLSGTFAAGTPLGGWTITITGTSGPATGDQSAIQTDAAGMAGFGLVQAGTYNVCADPSDTYQLIGSDANDGLGQVNGSCREGVPLVTADERPFGVTVDFYARPLSDDDADASPTPTPVEDVAGVATPGTGTSPEPTPTVAASEPTPAAPQAGTGTRAPARGTMLGFAFAVGMLVLTGLAAVRETRRR